MTLHYLPTEAEALALDRAAAHAVPGFLINPEARFAPGVTDARMASFLFHLEAGAQFTKDRWGRWSAEPGTTLAGMRNLPRVVQEAIRTGLVTEFRASNRRTVLVPAKTHLGIWDDGLAMWVTKCDAVGENMGPKRVRLVRNPVIVDCLSCL